MKKVDSIGIIGAGQLGLYLAREARKLGVKLSIVAQNKSEPACLDSPDLAPDLAKEVCVVSSSLPPLSWVESQSLLLFENENLDWHAWDSVLSSLPEKKRPECFPSLSVMKILSDKWEQKKLFQKCGIPTSGFQKIYSGMKSDDLALSFPLFLKWSRGGYDGRGVMRVTSEGEWSSQSVQEFIKSAEDKNVTVYAEEFVAFKKEVALVSAYDRSGNGRSYPLVETVQEKGVCQWVLPFDFSPVARLALVERREGLSPKEAAQKIAKATGITGVFAIEFFLQENEGGKVRWLANELAPRVHNSGHWSLSGVQDNQFRAQVYLSLGNSVEDLHFLPSGEKKWCGMRNLIVPASFTNTANAPLHIPNISSMSSAFSSHFELFWYGKADFFPGRKMGHLNFWSSDRKEFEEMRVYLLNELKRDWG